MIIFVGGGIGAGKSSVAKGLAEHLSLLYYDVDKHKRVIYRQDPDYQNNMDKGIPFCKETRMKVYRKVVGDFSTHYGIFDGGPDTTPISTTPAPEASGGCC